MKCQVCDKEFLSMEWYKADTDGLLLCDECVLYIYEARKKIKINEINALDRRIKEIKIKIDKEGLKHE